MGYLTVSSPVGALTIFEDSGFKGGGAIVALEWGRARTAFDLPLKPAGTAFQRRVWARLASIPQGRVETYGAIAKKLRSGARAVGGACGANPIPILIPCHRVLGAGGGLGGYSGEGGVATKRFLLAHEDLGAR